MCLGRVICSFRGKLVFIQIGFGSEKRCGLATVFVVLACSNFQRNVARHSFHELKGSDSDVLHYARVLGFRVLDLANRDHVTFKMLSELLFCYNNRVKGLILKHFGRTLR